MGVLLFILGVLVFFYGLIKLIIDAFKKRPYKKSAIIMFAGIVLFIVGAVMIPSSSKENKNSEKTEKTESNTADKSETKTSDPKKESKARKQEVTQVTFEQLINDYKANGAAADDKYKNKILEVQGVVTKVTKGTFSGSDVTIDAGNFTDNQFMKTTATMNMSNDVAKTLVAGQTYTFEAKLTGANIMDSGWVSNLSFGKGNVK